MDNKNTRDILESLRWDVDSLVYLGEYENYWWLTADFNKDGVRIGITGCCQYDYECEHHKYIRSIKNNAD